LKTTSTGKHQKELLDPVFAKCKTVIVLDSMMNETSSKADILLPVGTFTEAEGTLVNNEGLLKDITGSFHWKSRNRKAGAR